MESSIGTMPHGTRWIKIHAKHVCIEHTEDSRDYLLLVAETATGDPKIIFRNAITIAKPLPDLGPAYLLRN